MTTRNDQKRCDPTGDERPGDRFSPVTERSDLPLMVVRRVSKRQHGASRRDSAIHGMEPVIRRISRDGTESLAELGVRPGGDRRRRQLDRHVIDLVEKPAD